jgi:glycosyltransferase involved in cell wall biosynthesis
MCPYSSKTNEYDLSVVIAAYNEEAIINENIHRIVRELKTKPDVKWEIICVDDGSKDQTGPILDRLSEEIPGLKSIHHRRNFGQGRALRTAFNICKGTYIVTLDADLSYGPAYIYRLIDALLENRAEIALASPYMKGGTVRNVPFYRHFLSRVGNFYLARMSSYAISTSTCVVRAYHQDLLNHLQLTSDGMELQLEILMKASTNGFRVCEIPAHLEWSEVKGKKDGNRRVSKMKIMVLIIFSWLLIIPGGYMATALAIRFGIFMGMYASGGFFQAISNSLRDLIALYGHSTVFAVVCLLFGTQTLAFSLILLQNKFHFEEISRHIQVLNFKISSRNAPDKDSGDSYL